MKKSIYFKMQLKKTLKLYPAIFLITVLTIVSIVLTSALVLINRRNDESMQKISVGLVGDTENPYLQMGKGMLEKMDSSKFFIEFHEMTEKDAVSALNERRINGFVDVPKDFVKGVFYGINTPAKYVMNKAPSNFGSVLTGEVVDTASDWVTKTQKAIYSMLNVAKKTGNYDEKIQGKTDRLNFAFLDLVLNRENVYDVEVLGMPDSISIGGYYICGIIIFFLLLWGISCNKLLTSKNIELSRLLNIRGIKPMQQLVCEYFSFLIVTMLTLMIFAIMFGLAVQNNSFGIEELKTANVISCLMFVVKALPVIVMITTMHMMFYELVTSVVGGVLIQFLIAISLGYISGCFYPNYFFPESVQKTALVLPAGTGFSYLKKIMSGMTTISDIILPMLYAIIFFSGAVLTRKRRMAGDSK